MTLQGFRSWSCYVGFSVQARMACPIQNISQCAFWHELHVILQKYGRIAAMHYNRSHAQHVHVHDVPLYWQDYQVSSLLLRRTKV